MSDEDRRLAILAAVFAPARATALLARVPMPAAAEASTLATALAAAPRRERLEALSCALAADGAEARERAEAAAMLERGRIAALLRDDARGRREETASPILLRLVRERIAA